MEPGSKPEEEESGTWIQCASFPDEAEEVMVMRSLSEKDMHVAVVRVSDIISEVDLEGAGKGASVIVGVAMTAKTWVEW